ncbi:hypothetical protein STEG23_011803 [Scotinomys teguina]
MKTRCRSYQEATEHVAADRGPKMGRSCVKELVTLPELCLMFGFGTPNLLHDLMNEVSLVSSMSFELQ